MRERPSSTVRKFTVAVLWLGSVYLAVKGGYEPGLVPPEVRTSFPYPWLGVIRACLHTGIYSGLLYWMIRRTDLSFRGQLAKALLIFALLSLIHLIFYVTDVAGYVHVPAAFALLATVLLGIAWLVAAISANVRSADSRAG